jgi:hypothetical protein
MLVSGATLILNLGAYLCLLRGVLCSAWLDAAEAAADERHKVREAPPEREQQAMQQ